MQKSIKEDFDLQVRSIMEEAQEPAPAGAWEAISARLDAIAAASAATAASAASASAGSKSALAGLFGGRRVWYWAGAALAMAAAIALGVFFTGTSENNSNLINITDGSALVAEAAEPVESAQPLETSAAVEPAAAKVGMQNTHDCIQTPEKQAIGMQNPTILHTSQPAAPVADPSAQSAEATPAPSHSEPQAKDSAAEPAKPAVDPFALMAYEDSQKISGRKGISLLVSGGASSNTAGPSKLSQAAPGGYTQAGITETSKSSFGIPVVVGLGVRMQLSDALSIGTGLDYSMLTRTFEGKYTEGMTVTPGDFNHTLQYIGIPVDLFVKLVEKKDISLYSNIGTEAEYAISNKYRLLGTDTVVGDKVNGLQWSIGGGFGLEFNPGQLVGIFAEPTFKYYFNCDQPKNIRTDKPFQMILRVGVRFKL